jgi:CarD family transcriptional regulator
MAFQVGDQVVLPPHGVGQIVGLQERQFSEGERSLYYEVSTPRNTVWVAVDRHAANGLRKLASQAELRRCKLALQAPANPLNADHVRRRNELAQRMRAGNLRAMCEVVRDLTALRARRPLAEADASFLRRAHDSLCEEWAACRRITIEAAAAEVEVLLQVHQPAGKVN